MTYTTINIRDAFSSEMVLDKLLLSSTRRFFKGHVKSASTGVPYFSQIFQYSRPLSCPLFELLIDHDIRDFFQLPIIKDVYITLSWPI